MSDSAGAPGVTKERPGGLFRNEACGCTVDGFGQSGNAWRIRYCAKHAAAPTLYKALKGLLPLSECHDQDIRGAFDARWLAAKTALALAEGRDAGKPGEVPYPVHTQGGGHDD